MRIVSWNIRRARQESTTGRYLLELDPDVALLQEVCAIPAFISNVYSVVSRPAATKTGSPSKFSTALLVKSSQIETFYLTSSVEWVNDELRRFSGNLVAGRVGFASLVSVHSPAWPLDREKLKGYDLSNVKLEQNPDVWVTEILRSAVRESDRSTSWIVAGDFNSSETFDHTWGSGNQEVLDRMKAEGFTEILFRSMGKLTPTFRNPRGGKTIHQLDHFFVTNDLLSKLTACNVGNAGRVFDGNLSHHLPIIADFTTAKNCVCVGSKLSRFFGIFDREQITAVPLSRQSGTLTLSFNGWKGIPCRRLLL
jgi:exonuclease III